MTWLKAVGLLAWLVVSLVVAGVAVVALLFGMYAFADWLTKKAFAIVGIEALGLAFGALMLLIGALGLVGVLTGRSPPGTTPSQKVLALAVTTGMAFFGGVFVIAALAGWY